MVAKVTVRKEKDPIICFSCSISLPNHVELKGIQAIQNYCPRGGHSGHSVSTQVAQGALLAQSWVRSANEALYMTASGAK